MVAHELPDNIPSDNDSAQDEAKQHRIDLLLDAIELVKDDKREAALPILRNLINQDSDFEDAWLWMSVAVDSLDQAIICLDNVLRINPNNANAAMALYRLQLKEFAGQKKRAQLRSYRDMAFLVLWFLIFALMFAIMFTSSLEAMSTPM